MIRTLVLTCTFLVGASVQPALAQSAKKQARAFFKQGRQHYLAGQFAKALDAFEQANALRPHPLMLYNIGQVQEAMEDLSAAIATFKKYLTTSPNDADEVKAKVAELEKQLANWGQLALTTKPPGATVYVGKREYPARGRTPLQLPLPPGRQTLVFELEGYQQLKRSVTLKPRKAVKLTVAMPPVLAYVLVRSEPPGARMFFDGRPASIPTPATQGLRAGKHTLRVELDGFEPAERAFTLTPSHTRAKPFVLDMALPKAVPKGLLALELDGAGAQISIDGQVVGTSPLPKPVRLPQGLHKVEITSPQLSKPYQEMVNVVAGQTTTTKIDLDLDGGPGLDISTQTIGWALVGLGGATLLGSVVTSFLALGADGDLTDCRDQADCERTDRERELAEDVRSQALVTDILLGAGVAIAATGAALVFLTDDPAAPDEGTAVFVAPTKGGAFAGARWGW